jgi:hypothetical protein
MHDGVSHVFWNDEKRAVNFDLQMRQVGMGYTESKMSANNIQ